MATDPAICIECGAHVLPGRFSCPDCGALRASVRGRPDVAPVADPGQAADPGSVEPGSTSPSPIAGGYVPATPAVFPPVASPPVATVPDPAPGSIAAAAPAPALPAADEGDLRAPLEILVAAVPFETPYDASGWLVRGGSLGATLSFLLPWGASSVGVVGTGAIGYGYFDRWALVNAWYLLPMLLALFVFGLSVVPNRLLLWIRSGVLPLATGSLCLGIAFVYAGGPFGGGPGIPILVAASVASAAGGIVAVRPGRHDGPPPIV